MGNDNEKDNGNSAGFINAADDMVKNLLNNSNNSKSTYKSSYTGHHDSANANAGTYNTRQKDYTNIANATVEAMRSSARESDSRQGYRETKENYHAFTALTGMDALGASYDKSVARDILNKGNYNRLSRIEDRSRLETTFGSAYKHTVKSHNTGAAIQERTSAVDSFLITKGINASTLNKDEITAALKSYQRGESTFDPKFVKNEGLFVNRSRTKHDKIVLDDDTVLALKEKLNLMNANEKFSVGKGKMGQMGRSASMMMRQSDAYSGMQYGRATVRVGQAAAKLSRASVAGLNTARVQFQGGVVKTADKLMLNVTKGDEIKNAKWQLKADKHALRHNKAVVRKDKVNTFVSQSSGQKAKTVVKTTWTNTGQKAWEHTGAIVTAKVKIKANSTLTNVKAKIGGTKVGKFVGRVKESRFTKFTGKLTGGLKSATRFTFRRAGNVASAPFRAKNALKKFIGKAALKMSVGYLGVLAVSLIMMIIASSFITIPAMAVVAIFPSFSWGSDSTSDNAKTDAPAQQMIDTIYTRQQAYEELLWKGEITSPNLPTDIDASGITLKSIVKCDGSTQTSGFDSYVRDGGGYDLSAFPVGNTDYSSYGYRTEWPATDRLNYITFDAEGNAVNHYVDIADSSTYKIYAEDAITVTSTVDVYGNISITVSVNEGRSPLVNEIFIPEEKYYYLNVGTTWYKFYLAAKNGTHGVSHSTYMWSTYPDNTCNEDELYYMKAVQTAPQVNATELLHLYTHVEEIQVRVDGSVRAPIGATGYDTNGDIMTSYESGSIWRLRRSDCKIDNSETTVKFRYYDSNGADMVVADLYKTIFFMSTIATQNDEDDSDLFDEYAKKLFDNIMSHAYITAECKMRNSSETFEWVDGASGIQMNPVRRKQGIISLVINIPSDLAFAMSIDDADNTWLHNNGADNAVYSITDTTSADYYTWPGWKDSHGNYTDEALDAFDYLEITDEDWAGVPIIFPGNLFPPLDSAEIDRIIEEIIANNGGSLDSDRENFLRTALEQVGHFYYLYGSGHADNFDERINSGNLPAGLDCSGFMSYMTYLQGLDRGRWTPRGACDFVGAYTSVAFNGNYSNIQPGTILVKNRDRGGTTTSTNHVVIYAGYFRMWYETTPSYHTIECTTAVINGVKYSGTMVYSGSARSGYAYATDPFQ